ncbi:MAG TPA: ABC transporter permease [Candidatus Saccharimonadales bacterium]|nr:ABC transporter permease [Candidatus Saccharimonadales bacterium]
MTTPTALRVYEHQALVYRRTFRGSLISSFLNPILYLAAMGIGLGTYVDRNGAGGAAALGGLSYLVFIAPGLLAATAMQAAAGESTWVVMGAIKWDRTYDAMLATPIRVRDLVVGHLAWVTTRLLMVCAVFLLVMGAFGAAVWPSAILAIPAGVLTGLAFAAPITAFSATMDNDAGFNALFRFGIVPLFLFSGTFFPVSQLPELLRPLAYATPLYHGVELCRELALGRVDVTSVLVHVGYLVALAAVGTWLAARAYQRRLAK